MDTGARWHIVFVAPVVSINFFHTGTAPIQRERLASAEIEAQLVRVVGFEVVDGDHRRPEPVAGDGLQFFQQGTPAIPMGVQEKNRLSFQGIGNRADEFHTILIFQHTAAHPRRIDHGFRIQLIQRSIRFGEDGMAGELMGCVGFIRLS